jgi:hypothetical protein
MSLLIDMEKSESRLGATIHDAVFGIFADEEDNILKCLEMCFAGRQLEAREPDETWHEVRY